MDRIVASVTYVAEHEVYRDWWAVEDTSVDLSRWGLMDDEPTPHPTIALCDSEAIAVRVAELVNGDERLTELMHAERAADEIEFQARRRAAGVED